jgi:hypothetical protein
MKPYGNSVRIVIMIQIRMITSLLLYDYFDY